MLISLEPALASSFDGEAGSKQPPRRCGDHDFPGAGGLLQPSRQIGGSADYRMFLCRAVADKVADHYQPGGNPDAARQLLYPTIAPS
jgi:hypothetical protein